LIFTIRRLGSSLIFGRIIYDPIITFT
jgi:hypothetical protein